MQTFSRKQISLLTVVLALLLAVFRIAVSVSSLEPFVELYRQGVIADDILHVLIALCALILCSCMLLPLSDNPASDIRQTSQLTVFSATFCGFMILAYDLIFIYDAYTSDWAVFAPLLGRLQSEWVSTPANAVFALLMMIAAVPAAIYFLKVASAGAADKPSFSVFSSFAVLWFVLFVLNTYYDNTVALNSPVKVLRIFMILSFIMYAAHEGRRILDIALPRWYFAFAYLALFFGILVTVSDAVLYVKGILSLSDGWLGLAMHFAYILYILSRLLYLAASRTPKTARLSNPHGTPTV